MNEIGILLLVGLFAGFLSGLIGIGGGIILVPVLVYFLSMNQKLAQGTTLFMFLFPVGILGVYQYYKGNSIDYKTAGVMAITFIVGSFLGGKTAMAIDTKMVKQIFGGMIILIGIKMLFDK